MQFALFGGALAPRGGDAAQSARGYHDFLALNLEAERLGYRASFVTEHHFTGIGQVSATLTLLAWLAAHTTTLRLGTAVMVLPWHDPVQLAEQAATVDLLSGGRLDLGVGKGYRHTEFAGFALPPGEAEARFDEALEVLVRAFASDQPFRHEGQFWRYGEIAVEPPPFQRPHPPIWIAAGRPQSIVEAAQRGCNLMLNQFASPADIGRAVILYRDTLEAAGQVFDPMRVAVARNLWVAESRAETEAAAKRQAGDHARIGALSLGSHSRGAHINAYAAPEGGREAHSLIGETGEIAERLAELQQLGVAYVLLNGLGDGGNYRRFAERIMPAFSAA